MTTESTTIFLSPNLPLNTDGEAEGYAVPMMVNGKRAGQAHVNAEGELQNPPDGTLMWAPVFEGSNPIMALVWTRESAETRMHDYG